MKNEKKTNQNIETEAQTAENTGVKEAVKNDFESNGGASANQTDVQNSPFEAGEKPEKTVPDVSKNKKKNIVICGSIVVALALVAGIVTANSKPKADQKQPESDKTADIAEKTDTEPPVITFKKDKLEVKVGDSYDVAANIKSVVDDQDGKLEQVKKLEDGQAGYIVKSEQIKEAKAGTFSVEVTAVDSAGNKAKSSFDVVVSEAKTEDKADAEKKNENKEEKTATSSKGSSAANSTNQSGTTASSKPNTGSSSGSSSNTSSGKCTSIDCLIASRPNGSSGGSGSSGSNQSSGNSGSSNTKPNTGGSSSGANNNNGTTNKPSSSCTTVVVKDAWTETVVDKKAWVETVIDKPEWTEKVWVVDVPAHDEPIYEVKTVCNTCGQVMNTAEELVSHILDNPSSPCFNSGYGDRAVQTGTKHVDEVGHYETISHPAETHTVSHPAETHTVTHPAETKEVCG